MKVRLLALVVGLAIAATVTPAPAAAAVAQPAASSVLTPAQTGATEPAQWGGGYFGYGGPWWAGMPLTTISASTGGTWPWAPYYWTPSWWTLVALSGNR